MPHQRRFSDCEQIEGVARSDISTQFDRSVKLRKKWAFGSSPNIRSGRTLKGRVVGLYKAIDRMRHMTQSTLSLDPHHLALLASARTGLAAARSKPDMSSQQGD
jgi:hypothetical protein